MIPNLVHAYWGGGPLPDWQAALLDVWRDKHDVMFWTDDNLPEMRTRDLFDDPARYSPSSHPGQYRANLLRYEVLHDYGGVWVDCDLEWRRDIGPLLELSGFAAWETQDQFINNAFLGFPAEHPALTAILDGLRHSVLSQPSQRSNVQSGAQYITPILRGRDDVTVLPQSQVYPYRWDELDRADSEFPDVWVVHHWANARRKADRGR